MTGQKARIRRTIWIGIVSALFTLSAYASALAETPSLAQSIEPVVLIDEQGKYPLGLHLEFLEDPGGELTIEDVSSPQFDSRFSPSRLEVPNYGYTDSAYWLRLRLINETSLIHQWFLEAQFANLNYVDLYIPSEGGGFEKKESGILRPFDTRDIPYYRIVFKVLLADPNEQTLYLRVISGSSMSLDFILWSPEAFAVNKVINMLWTGLFYGALLMVLGYHVFLFLSLKEASYFYFVLFLASTIVFFATYEGVADQFLWPGSSQAKLFPLIISMSCVFLSALKFSDAFLELDTRLPGMYRLYYPFYGYWLLLVGILPFASWGLMTQLASVGLLLTPLLLTISGFFSWRGGYQPARLYLVSWLGFLLGVIFEELVRSGMMRSTPMTEHSYQIGLIWLVWSCSLALADRINLLKAETESANLNLHHNRQRLAQILESIPLGLVVYGRDQKLRYMNQRTVELLSNPAEGLSPNARTLRSLSQAIEYLSLKVAGTNVRYPLQRLPVYTALKGESAYADDLEADLGEGPVQLEVWASPILDEMMAVESAVATLQNITQRRQTEAELTEYRKQLEVLVEQRTAELNLTNQELRQRIEWLAAINQVNQILAGSADFTRVYEKIVAIINDLFATRHSFVAELVEQDHQLIIREHSCRSDAHPDLIGSRTTLLDHTASPSSQEHGMPVVFPIDPLALLDGPLGVHIQFSRPPCMVLVPLKLREQTLGFLGLELEDGGRIFTKEETSLLSILSTDIAQLIEDAHLFEQVKLLIAAEERSHLARELHDSVAQGLFSINLFSDATLSALEFNKQDVVRRNLIDLVELSRQAMADMRLLIFELRPPDLEDVGLEAALQNRLDRVESKAGIQAIFLWEGKLLLSPEQEDQLYWIAQEALNNTIKHAHASWVKVQLTGEAGCMRMEIQDNGVGFDPDQAGQSGGQGIRNIHERAEKIGATCSIESVSGHGTRLTIEVKE